MLSVVIGKQRGLHLYAPMLLSSHRQRLPRREWSFFYSQKISLVGQSGSLQGAALSETLCSKPQACRLQRYREGTGDFLLC